MVDTVLWLLMKVCLHSRSSRLLKATMAAINSDMLGDSLKLSELRDRTFEKLSWGLTRRDISTGYEISCVSIMEESFGAMNLPSKVSSICTKTAPLTKNPETNSQLSYGENSTVKASGIHQQDYTALRKNVDQQTL